MIKIGNRFGFYAVLTNPLKGFEYLTELLVDNNMPFVQLRIKAGPEEQIRDTALKMRQITSGTTTKLIINDHPHIAAEIDADGVHIGQQDMPYVQVRQLVGEKIVGMSTHNPEQTSRACEAQPDYIGVGPVYPTPTKVIPDPVIGLDGMKRMLSVATVPAVCIGGIDLENLPRVLEAGAENFCMVRQFVRSDNPAKILKEIIRIYNSFYPWTY